MVRPKEIASVEPMNSVTVARADASVVSYVERKMNFTQIANCIGSANLRLIT